MSTRLHSICVCDFLDCNDDSKKITFDFSDAGPDTTTTLKLPNGSRTIELPDFDTTLVGEDTAQVLTNKIIDTASNTLSVHASDITGGLSRLGRVAVVDQINGDDAKGAVGGAPFLTIGAACAACASGEQVWILPGTYNESLVIPAGIAVRGISVKSVVIQRTGVTSSTTLITMGENSRIEDVTLRVTSATAGLTLTGILLPGTTTETARVRSVVLEVSNTSTGTGNMYGIHSTGTGAPVAQDVLRAITVTVSGAVTGTCRGIRVGTAAGLVQARDINVDCTRTSGAGSYIGVETVYAGCGFTGRHSNLSGTSADISQTAGVITIGATPLRTSNANGLGFTSLDTNELWIYSTIGNLSNGTRYLRTCGADSANELFMRVPVTTIIKSISVRSRVAMNGSSTCAVTVRKNGTDTVITATIPNNGSIIFDDTKSVAFNTGDDISVACLKSGTTNPADLTVVLETY